MKNNSIFYQNLRNYFIENATPSNLIQSPLFRKTHFNTYLSEKNASAYIVHRCNQWLSDLRSASRTPGLTIEDLEVACKIKNDSVGAIVESDTYWRKKLDYLNDDFISFLLKLKNSKQYNGLLKNLSLPIRFDPRSSTLLIVVSIDTCEENSFHKQLTLENSSQTTSYDIRFVVISTSNYVYSFLSEENKSHSKEGKLVFSDYNIALQRFESVCSCENDASYRGSFSYNIEMLSHRLISNFFDVKKGGLAEILNCQKLFYGYHSASISPEIKRNIKRNKDFSAQIKNAKII